MEEEVRLALCDIGWSLHIQYFGSQPGLGVLRNASKGSVEAVAITHFLYWS
jgi:hypothetical protein